MTWAENLYPATYRGIPFAVLGSEARFGRRVAEHEYPNRDKPWIEDMGRSTRRITMTGFLVSDSLIYGGGDVVLQRNRMIAAAETAGSGVLIHPTLGQLTVSIPDGGLSVVEKWDGGQYFELSFSFIESGDAEFPTAEIATYDSVYASVVLLQSAAASDFLDALNSVISTVYSAVASVVETISSALDAVDSVIDSVVSAVSSALSSVLDVVDSVVSTALSTVSTLLEAGDSVISAVVDTVSDFTDTILSTICDASSITGLVSQMTGELGRYASGALSDLVSGSTIASLLLSVASDGSSSSSSSSSSTSSTSTSSTSSVTMDQLVDALVMARATATASCDALSTAGAALTADTATDFATAAQTAISDCLGCISDPADAIRLMPSLAGFSSFTLTSGSQIGQAVTAAQFTTSTLLRRLSIAAMAQVSAEYEPSSYDDAVTVRDNVLAYIDSELTIAGDLSDDSSYSALRSLRQSVVSDFASRGADLSKLRTFTYGASLPSLVLANRLYQDMDRTDDLVSEADPIHPAFMPVSFSAQAT